MFSYLKVVVKFSITLLYNILVYDIRVVSKISLASFTLIQESVLNGDPQPGLLVLTLLMLNETV